jgi:hypothetical protein
LPEDTYTSKKRTKRASYNNNKYCKISKKALALLLTIATATGAGTGILGTKAFEKNYPTQPEQYNNTLEQINETSDVDELERLYDKYLAQQQVATAFRDGDYVYYMIDFQNESEKRSMTISEFKELFDIKDDAISKCNNLDKSSMDTIPIDDEGHEMYLPDTAVIHSKDIIKVPVDSIKEDK